MFDHFLVKSFPGFLSIRDTKHQIIYLNDNFRNWIYRYTDVEPLGKTNHELAALVPINVAKVFLQCHDISLSWQKNCTSTENLKKVILFDEDNIDEKTQYFDMMKCGIEIEGEPHIFTVGYDITDMYQKNLSYVQKIKHIAWVDELTGERSFFKFKEDAQELLNNFADSDDSIDDEYALIKLDIENFKLINKTFGLDVGDQVLKTVSLAIKSLLTTENAVFSRLLVDDFVILCRYHGRDALNIFRESLIAQFKILMQGSFDYNIKFKFGQYIIKRESGKELDINEFYEFVNFAHHQAKQRSDVDVVFYEEICMLEALRQKEIENNMTKALAQHEFLVFLQPKYCLCDENLCGAEALVRWKTSQGNYIYPDDFIPIFERNGFITQLDMYMLEGACGVISRWISNGIKPVTISVNFSRQHLKNKNFVTEICDIVDKFQIERKWIEIELTETAIFDNIELLEDILNALHKAGFTMSMDDFGSGYSSLGLLKNLAVDVIKIDRSFFVKQENEQRSNIVLGSVFDMAKKLGIHTVAEGVEERVHIDLLRELGCDMVQGYYYAKPMPEKEMDQLLIATRASKET